MTGQLAAAGARRPGGVSERELAGVPPADPRPALRVENIDDDDQDDDDQYDDDDDDDDADDHDADVTGQLAAAGARRPGGVSERELAGIPPADPRPALRVERPLPAYPEYRQPPQGPAGEGMRMMIMMRMMMGIC
jgi:hypothetical protein